MKLLTLCDDAQLFAACTLRDPSDPLEGSTALHTTHDQTAVMQNRQALSHHLGIPLTDWCLSAQTHSAHAYHVRHADRGRGACSMDDAIADCDALYTEKRRLLIGVFTADCVPLLCHDPHSGIIAAIHSGWPGTVKQITHHTLRTLLAQGLQPASTRVWIGPCIHTASFQIRQDVIDQIRALPFDTAPYLHVQADGSALCDNVGLNVHMLQEQGIPRDNIHICALDTCAERTRCFSYRRDHTTQRHLTFLYRK